MTTQSWTIDTAHSAVQFSIRHMVISKVRGAFTQWEGRFDFDPENPEATRASATIETASIDTHEPKRDAHLRSADFFDAEQHPQITFQSTRVEKTGDDRYRMVGDLTVHGTTREVDLEVTYLGSGKDPWGGERVGFSGRTTIRRKDFGLNWNQVLEAGSVLVGEDVEIALDVQAVRAQSGEKAA